MNQIGMGAVLLLLIYILSSPNWGTSQHTIFEVHCPKYGSNIYDCPQSLDAFKSTYIAIPEIQAIIGKRRSSVWKYDNCTVFDAENWTCYTNDDAHDQSMQDGVYLDLSDNAEKPKRRTISRIEYDIRNIVQFVTSL